MSDPLPVIQAAAAVRDRGNLISIVVQCLEKIRAKDHLLVQLMPGIPEDSQHAIGLDLAAQDNRLYESISSVQHTLAPNSR